MHSLAGRCSWGGTTSTTSYLTGETDGGQVGSYQLRPDVCSNNALTMEALWRLYLWLVALHISDHLQHKALTHIYIVLLWYLFFCGRPEKKSKIKVARSEASRGWVSCHKEHFCYNLSCFDHPHFTIYVSWLIPLQFVNVDQRFPLSLCK